MKSKIKRHWRSVMSVVLAVCMLISCMTVGLIATDAARVNDEAVGGSDSTITDYKFKGAFDSWTEHYVNSEGKAYINIDTAGTYDFVVITGGGTQRRANKTFIESGSYNTSEDNTNFKITVTNPGTYTFQTTLIANSSVTVTVTFPSGSSTSTSWSLVDGDCSWTPASSTKNFTLNSSTGYYEYTQTFAAADNYFRIYDGTSQYNGNGGSSDVTLTAGADFVDLGSATTNKAFYFRPSTAGKYIIQVDAENSKVKIQQASTYSVTCTTPTNGTLTSSASSGIYEGDSVTITATPSSGYTLKSLVLTYDDVGHNVTSSVSDNSYTFAMPAYNVTVTAEFANSRTIYFNNYVTQWTKVYAYTYTSSGTEGNGSNPGMEMTRVGTSSIYSVEVPTDMDYIIFSGSGGANNKDGTITCNGSTIGNAIPSTPYNEYKATNTSSGTSSTGTWSTHTGRSNVYTVTPGRSVTGNSNLYYNGITATLYDYYTDGEVANGWIDGIKEYSSGRSAEYSRSNGDEYYWNPYKTFDTALSRYAYANSITYPLYFGNLNITNGGEGYLEYETGNTTKFTNWYYKINNSLKLSPNTTSVTGLANSSEGNSTINHSNGTAMAMFDEDWLSQENSTGSPLATILNSSGFPVRKVEMDSDDYIYIYCDVSACTWYTNDSCVPYINCWNSSSSKQVAMKLVSGTIYEAIVEKKYTNFQFYRHNSSYSGNHVAFNLPTDNKILAKINSDSTGIDSWTTYASAKTPVDYTYYEYDSTDGTDNAYIQNLSTSANTATIEYSTTDKVSSCDNNAGFYPFDNLTGDKTYNHVGSTAQDLGYGMKLEIPFTLNENGTLDGTASGIAQTFNFSGDDDLWVYIDGKLVLDLGGAHLKAEGSIDFKDLKATSTTKVVSAATAAASADSDTYTATATYSNDFSSGFDTNSETVHTMTLYYMERGMYDSNLKFNFSFHAISNLYTTEKKVRTNNINSGFYVLNNTTNSGVQNSNGYITKFEKSYQTDSFDFDHKVSSALSGTYAYPSEDFTYSKVTVTPGASGESSTTSSQTYTAGNALSYSLTNDDKAQFNGKFKTGDYFKLTEKADSGNKYNYTPSLTLYDDNDGSTNDSRFSLTDDGSGSYRFRFDEDSGDEMQVVNVRARFQNAMNQHSLTITKNISGDTTTNDFTFKVLFNFDYEDSGDNGYEAYPLYISSSTDGTKTQLNADGSMTIKAGEIITIAGIPENADFKIIETDVDSNYEYGSISAIGATPATVSGENAVTMTMGSSDINATINNVYNQVKATIRVKYAPSYYDFENNTANIQSDTYKPNGTSFDNITNNIGVHTEFYDTTYNSRTNGSSEITEKAVTNASDTFKVKISDYGLAGYLFIGWYDENGNRWNDTDETQHEPEAEATKAQDRVFEARFIAAPTYRIDYDVPTRLWGSRIYKVFGTVTHSMINSSSIGYDSTRDSDERYYITGKLVEDNKPSEKLFLKSITWANIDTSLGAGKNETQYNVQKTVTSNADTSKNVETTTGTVTYSMYRYAKATVSDTKVKVDMYNDCSNPNTLQKQYECNYGESVNGNNTVAVNIPAGMTFYRWRIETLNSLGKSVSTKDGTLVTYDYSKNFNYVAYDNYKVTAETIEKRGGKDFNPNTVSNENDPYHGIADAAVSNQTTVINLGQTRSHWNDTITGQAYVPGENDSTSNTNANYNYDRLFIDLALSYSDGNETMLNSLDDCTVGFKIQYYKNGEWHDWANKTVTFSSKELDNKNRIEYYYGFSNSAANRGSKLRVQPIIDGVEKGKPVEFQFNGDLFTAQT